MKSSIRNSFLLLITATIWGSAFVAQSVGMEYIGPFTFTGVRNIIGSIILIPVIIFISKIQAKNNFIPTDENGNEITAKQYIHNSIIGGICCGIFLCAASNFQQCGIQYTTVGKAGFITAMYVILVPIVGLFFHKKVTPLIWFCVILSVTGLYLLCMTTGDLSIQYGDILLLICALLFTFHIIVINHFTVKANGVLMSSIQFFVCGVISLVLMFIFENPSIEAIMNAMGPILYAGVLSSGVAYTLQIVAQKNVNPTIASLIMCLESVISALSGWLILHQKLTVREIIGCILMFVAICLAQLPTSTSTSS